MLQSVDMVAEEGDFLSGCLVNVDTTVDKDCAAGSSADVFRAKAGQCFLTVAGNRERVDIHTTGFPVCQGGGTDMRGLAADDGNVQVLSDEASPWRPRSGRNRSGSSAPPPVVRRDAQPVQDFAYQMPYHVVYSLRTAIKGHHRGDDGHAHHG